MWRQVITPNVNVSAELGMCLSYVQRAFGVGWSGSYALDAWNRNSQFNHQDRNMPSGVYVPVFFTGYWNGFNYGHVVVYKDGICYSSPYTYKSTYDQLGNIETVERIYGMKFLGWSEGLAGSRIIEYQEATNMANIIGNSSVWRTRMNEVLYEVTGEQLGDAEFVSIVGRDAFDVTVDWIMDRARSGANEKKYAEAVSLNSQLQQSNAVLIEENRVLKGLADEAAVQAAESAAAQKAAESQSAQASAKATELQNQADADKVAGDSLLRRIGQFVAKYLPGVKG